ncbi:MAG TPA: ABC-F family ATP-binding cassette domain-containing protein [Firmicutes bacterium]|nr:ABC-F family ATP-binding cassette domain-containing protein [Bacillota bacterium]
MSQTLLRVTNLAKSFGWYTVFHNVNFILSTGEKAALVGPNGVGKSTLFRILAGLDEPTFGSVTYLSDRVTCGYLPQYPEFGPAATAVAVLSAEEAMLGAAARATAAEALARFGFSGADANLPAEHLSGGQKTRLALARIWLSLPDLLLLDEPTNHLDYEGIAWLEGFVRDYPHTVLVISHDRYFLNQVAGRILELSPNGITAYNGNYDNYRQQKEAAFQQQLRNYTNTQREIKRIEAAIDRQMRWFLAAHRRAGQHDFYRSKAKKGAQRAKATIKRLERLKERSVEKPKAQAAISLQLDQEQRTGNRVFLATDLGHAYSRPLFRHADFAILHGEKVGIIGPNGAGKTTLLRLLLGEEQPTWGNVWRTPSLRPGYLEQEMESLDLSATLLDGVLSLLPVRTPEGRQRTCYLLASFLFPQETWCKPLQALSYGERKRVALIRLLLCGYNVLVLDEPTNHLDLPAREKLEEALRAYDGTILVVSHDRYLIQNVCTKVLCIRDERIEVYPGTFNEYMNWRRAQEAVRHSRQRTT